MRSSRLALCAVSGIRNSKLRLLETTLWPVVPATLVVEGTTFTAKTTRATGYNVVSPRLNLNAAIDRPMHGSGAVSYLHQHAVEYPGWVQTPDVVSDFRCGRFDPRETFWGGGSGIQLGIATNSTLRPLGPVRRAAA